MIVNAFDNPKLAAKYEAEIGALMAKTAKNEGRDFGKHVPGYNPVREEAQRKRDIAGPMVVKILLKYGPLARDAIVRLVAETGHKLPRDASTHALIDGQQGGYINVAGERGQKRWFICNERLAKEYLVRNAPAMSSCGAG